jgi:hypothetical protein
MTDDPGMKNPQKPQGTSEPRPAKLSARPRQYVDVNDLRQMLKLALGLHTVGEPLKKMNRALDGLARLAAADAWVAAVVAMKPRNHVAIVSLFQGGTDPVLAEASARRLESEMPSRETSIGQLLFTRSSTPGRVLAAIERQRAICSILPPESSERGRSLLTWVSIHRAVGKSPFEERERRMVELFHSQSAWLVLQMKA